MPHSAAHPVETMLMAMQLCRPVDAVHFGRRPYSARMSSGARGFQQRLFYEEVHPSKPEIFDPLYAIYADLFPLPDEREPPEAFLELAALNHRSDVQSLYGPWRESVVGI